MATLVPTVTSALVSQGIGLATNALGGNSKDLAVQQLQEQQKLQEQQLLADAALEKQRIATDAANAEDERKTALRRAVSRQKASFAGQGVGAGAGSSQAVLLGMFEESEEDKRRREELDTLRLSAIDQDVTHRQSINVLQRTQLEEKQKVNSISSGISSLF